MSCYFHWMAWISIDKDPEFDKANFLWCVDFDRLACGANSYMIVLIVLIYFIPHMLLVTMTSNQAPGHPFKWLVVLASLHCETFWMLIISLWLLLHIKKYNPLRKLLLRRPIFSILLLIATQYFIRCTTLYNVGIRRTVSDHIYSIVFPNILPENIELTSLWYCVGIDYNVRISVIYLEINLQGLFTPKRTHLCVTS